MKTVIIEGTGYKQAYDNPAGIDLPNKKLKSLENYDYGNGLLRGLMHTGIRLQMPDDMFAVIKPRSSAIKRGVQVIEGVLDSDYTGEVFISFLCNEKFADYDLKDNEIKSFAQLVFYNKPQIRLINGTITKETARGDKGFGSSDKE